MANYEGCCKSNQFQVKDGPAFEKFMEEQAYGDLEIWPCNPPPCGHYRMERISEKMPKPKVYPTYQFGGYEGIVEELRDGGSFYKELAKHLVRGEVAIIIEAGNEKLRYVGGYGVIVNWKGRIKSVNLIDEAIKVAKSMAGKNNEVSEDI